MDSATTSESAARRRKRRANNKPIATGTSAIAGVASDIRKQVTVLSAPVTARHATKSIIPKANINEGKTQPDIGIYTPRQRKIRPTPRKTSQSHPPAKAKGTLASTRTMPNAGKLQIGTWRTRPTRANVAHNTKPKMAGHLLCVGPMNKLVLTEYRPSKAANPTSCQDLTASTLLLVFTLPPSGYYSKKQWRITFRTFAKCRANGVPLGKAFE